MATRIEKQNRRRKQAEARNEKWADTSLKDQLASLDERFGEGIGAKRQRARIQEKIKAQTRKEEKTKNAKSTDKIRKTKQKKRR